MVVTSAVSLPVPDDLVERLSAESEASGLQPRELAASLLEEGLKTREFPGVV